MRVGIPAPLPASGLGLGQDPAALEVSVPQFPCDPPMGAQETAPGGVCFAAIGSSPPGRLRRPMRRPNRRRGGGKKDG